MNQSRADQILSFRPRKKQRIVRQLHGVVAKIDALISAIGKPAPAPSPLNQRYDRSAPMASSPRCIFTALLGTLALAVPLGLASPAIAQTKLKLVLNWKYQGPQGMFFLAEDRGYYKAEGLEVTIDPGNGCGAALPLVAHATYDPGFADLNPLIEPSPKNPD